MMPYIGIVTVLYNSESVLEAFFDSLNSQTYKEFILIIVDNKSPDQSLAASKKLALSCNFKTIIIENGQNDGVAKGNNIGIREALDNQCDYILLSNNDVTLEPNTISALLDGLQRNKCTMAVPKIYYFGTNLIWAAGGFIQRWSGLVLHHGDRQLDSGQFDLEREVTYSATCFMLISKSVFEKVGLMDELYFVYWDDVDFVYRARGIGEHLWYIPSSVVHHKDSTSTVAMSNFSVRYLARNAVYFALKQYKIGYALYVILLNITHHCLVLIFKWPFEKWRIRMSAYWEGVKLFHSSENRLKF